MNNKNKKVRKYFSSVSGEYQDSYKTETPLTIRLRKVLEMLEKSGTSRIKSFLDIGCGTGELARKIYSLHKCNVNAVDISGDMIKVAKSLTPKNFKINFSTGNIEELKFADDSFDTVTSVGVFEYLDDDKKALEQIYRVLKKDGIAIIEMRNDLFSLFSMNRHTVNFFLKRAGLSELKLNDGYPFKRRAHNPITFKRKAEKIGFKFEGLRFYHFHPLPPFFNSLSFYDSLGRKMEKLDKTPLRYLLASAFLIKLRKVEKKL